MMFRNWICENKKEDTVLIAGAVDKKHMMPQATSTVSPQNATFATSFTFVAAPMLSNSNNISQSITLWLVCRSNACPESISPQESSFRARFVYMTTFSKNAIFIIAGGAFIYIAVCDNIGTGDQ